MNTEELLNELATANMALNKVSQGIADGIEGGNFGYISDKVESTLNLCKHVLAQAKHKKKTEGKKVKKQEPRQPMFPHTEIEVL